jgi:hypothetical protein
MFVAFMPPFIYFCTDVFLHIYSASRKRLLLIEFKLEFRSKPNLENEFQNSLGSKFPNFYFEGLQNIV